MDYKLSGYHVAPGSPDAEVPPRGSAQHAMSMVWHWSVMRAYHQIEAANKRDLMNGLSVRLVQTSSPSFLPLA